MSDYGIDYGMGKSNVDATSGIRYGVINQHDLAGWATDDFEADYGDPACPHCGGPVVEWFSEYHDDYDSAGCDYACEHCEKSFESGDCYGDEPCGHSYQREDYALSLDSSGDVWVLKSPYFTHAAYCSPCAPGACHLSHPVDSDGPKCYALGHEWFEGDKPPYPVYRVADGQQV